MIALAGATVMVSPGWAATAEPTSPPHPPPPDPTPFDPPPFGEDALLPNAERPVTHSELLTIRGECKQNDCGSRALVADTVIERDPPSAVRWSVSTAARCWERCRAPGPTPGTPPSR